MNDQTGHRNRGSLVQRSESLLERSNTMKTSLKRLISVGAPGLAIAAAAWFTAGNLDWARAGEKTVPIVVDNTPLTREIRATTSFAPVIRKVGPSVVNVFTTKRVQNPFGREMRPFFDDPFFRRFFGGPFGNDAPERAPREFKQQNLGSGVIVTRDGYILTNNHVVDGADEIKVSLANSRKEYTATIVGRDPKTDLAVLRIDEDELPFVTLTDSDKVEVGDIVLAIGNPFGVGQTVTMGIVSATGRGGMGIEHYEDFIQTDAAINPGNSGGPLVDLEGRLIGINTAILSRSGGNQGVGFAVPANLARDVMRQLIESGKVERGFLGVFPQDVTPELARAFRLPEPIGALISEVTPDSAADKAGLKVGDIIVEFDGKEVRDARGLRLLVGGAAPGARINLKVIRDGKDQTLAVTLKQMPDDSVASLRGGSAPADDSGALSGVTVGDIDANARRQFNLPDDLEGAVIMRIDPDSASYEAGLRPGDVIQEIDHEPVKSAAEAVAVSKRVKSGEVLVRLWSRGVSQFKVIEEEKRG